MKKTKPSFAKIRSSNFNGKRYKIQWRKPYKCQGLCDDPKTPAANRFIVINPKVSELEFLDSICHEVGHSIFWNLDEECITKFANDLSGFLYKVGFRLKKD